MYFQGPPVKVLSDTLDVDKLSELVLTIHNRFGDKWIKRSLNLMSTSYALRAITPMNVDSFDIEVARELDGLIRPYFQPFLGNTHVIAYMDVSSLPPGAESLPHFDNTWLHMLSNRIRIPLITNPKSVFALKTINGITNYNLKVGKVYETNNQCLHLAANLGDTNRWHLMADIMYKPVYDWLVETKRIGTYCVDPTINFSYSESAMQELRECLHLPTEDL